MLDFTEGWTWFVSGLAATILTALVTVAVVLAARQHGS